MAGRVCPTPGCPTITTGGHCTTHQRAADQARGRRQARGYDKHYDRARANLARQRPPHCANCGDPFTPDNPMTGGHIRALRNGAAPRPDLAPHCRRCNYGWRRTGL